jgi:hypothetical protein
MNQKLLQGSKPGLIGIRVIEFEKRAVKLPPDQLEALKEKYVNFVQAGLDLACKKGIDAMNTKSRILELWEPVSTLMLENAVPSNSKLLMVQGLKENSWVCDTSLLPFADILRILGMNLKVVQTRWGAKSSYHAILNISMADGPVYIETLLRYNGEKKLDARLQGHLDPSALKMFQFCYFESELEVIDLYGSLISERPLGREQAIDMAYARRGFAFFQAKDFKRAVGDLDHAVKKNANAEFASSIRERISPSSLGKTARKLEKGNKLDLSISNSGGRSHGA